MKSLLIDEFPLLVPPSLAIHIGLNEAIILQQIHYWLNPKSNKNFFDNRYWVWNTYAQWQEQFPFWSEMTIRRTINHLEEMGILLSTYGGGFQKTKFYTIDYSRIKMLENKIAQKPMPKRVPPYEFPEHIDMVKWNKSTDQNVQSDLLNLSGENDQVEQGDMINMSSENDQSERINSINLIVSYIDTETTTETTPPLTPAQNSVAEKNQKNEEEELFQKMISVWNDSIQGHLHENSKIVLSDKRCSALKSLKESVLNIYGLSWEDYCGKISNNGFLMGKSDTGFKVNFDWALQPEKAKKIIEGVFFEKKPKETKASGKEGSNSFPQEILSWTEIETQIAEKNQSNPHVQDWMAICRCLKKDLGEDILQSFFMNAELIELTECEAVIQVENAFAGHYMESRYGDNILCAVQKQYPHIKRMLFRGNIRTDGERDEVF